MAAILPFAIEVLAWRPFCLLPLRLDASVSPLRYGCMCVYTCTWTGVHLHDLLLEVFAWRPFCLLTLRLDRKFSLVCRCCVYLYWCMLSARTGTSHCTLLTAYCILLNAGE
jgi:hypothetical protein